MPVIDFHSHILPKMDDGSRSSQMSLDMLRYIKDSGTDIVVATPHYSGNRETASHFVQRRDAAWRHLSKQIDHDECPIVLLGAEISFYSKLSEEPRENLDALCIDGTNVLLLEMPFTRWTNLEVDTLSHLCYNMNYRIILAHIERFMKSQNPDILERIMLLPIYTQIDADILLSRFKRRRWLKILQCKRVPLLGSDCHNMEERPPNLDLARQVIRKKLGDEVLRTIDECGAQLLNLTESAQGVKTP